MRKVVFYTRRSCCLCDDALAVVHAVRARVPFELAMVDVDSDPALVAQFGDKVPVITVDGRLHAKFRVDATAFERRLAGADTEVQA